MKLKLREKIKEHKRPFLIAGPCSVESQEQVEEIAKELSALGKTSLLRGGIWKPRTRPDSFEGIGALGLPWLVEAGRKHNIPVTTEVANSRHVEMALKAGVDVLWIGARTTANPFAVQEIADALQGVSIPVMVKNPINPDLNLWIGAFERLQNSGINDLVAIHRGFSVYNHPKYRNSPNWEIPIALMEKMPDMPIICDPSHICGNTNDIQYVSQKSLDLNFEGLMIETHHQPEKAWSDSQQQVTPEMLTELLSNLVLRDKEIKKEELDFIELQRRKITEIDDHLFELLKTRMGIADEIGNYKRENGIVILQTEHWQKTLSKYLSHSKDSGLSEEFIRALLDAIHQESINHQNVVMNKRS